MRAVLFALLGATMLAVSSAALAEEKAAAKPPEEKPVCRSEPQIGSILRKRVCRTRAEWAAIKSRDEVSTKRVLEDSGVKQTGIDPNMR